VSNGHVSTGTLPTAETVQALVDEAHARYKGNDEGQNAQHYPAPLPRQGTPDD
jgi:glutaminase